MDSSQVPTPIQKAFSAAGEKNTIPVSASPTPGLASYELGFPPLTRTPLAAGGIPPSGADFNGILNAITAIQQYQSAGGIFRYDAALSTAIGGYPKGAVLISTSGTRLWRSLVENNTSNPDVGSPPGWTGADSGRLINVRVFDGPASGTYTPTAGTLSVVVEVLGGGGGGGGAAMSPVNQVAFGGGGGGGGYARAYLGSGFAGIAYAVGAPGASSIGAPGGGGGNTSFGTISATGGQGGSLGTATTYGAAGVSGVSGGVSGGLGANANLIVAQGGPGKYAIIGQFGVSGEGGASVFGSGAIGSSQAGEGAASRSSGAGGAGGNSGTMNAGGFIDGAARGGGVGGSGRLIIWEYA